MPANVSPEYAKAEKKFRKARGPEEKLAALREMKRTAPSHKGAENLRAEITRKIKKTKQKIKKEKEQRKKASARSIAVKKEGIGQIVLVGLPNSGKSTLLNTLTNANVEIAPYPFTTKEPEIGMLDYKGAKIQLVEVPPLIEGSSEGKAMGRELFSLIRNSDAVALVLSACSLFRGFKVLKKEFEKSDLVFNKGKAPVSIKKSEFSGVSLINPELFLGDSKKLKKFLRTKGLSNSRVIFREKTNLKQVRETMDSKTLSKRALGIVIKKTTKEPNEKALASLKKDMTVISLDSINESKREELKQKIFELLDTVLVFTKKPGEEKATKPMALPLGSTVEDAAAALHKDFEKNFRYAKIWGSAKYPGQRVARDYELKTGDTVEIYG